MNRFIAIVKAAMALVIRTISSHLKRRILYWTNKKRYWGKVSFNKSVCVAPQSTFEGANKLGERSYFSGNMGYGTYLCNDCSIIGNIGRFCSIAPEVKNSVGVHPIGAPYVSTSPMFFSLRKQTGKTFAKKQLFEELKSPIEIGHDCWLGQGTFIVGGIKIGTGSIVLAGAVVTKDVPPYAIVGGVPAKVLNYRFDKETIDFLMKSEWWNMPIEWLESNWELFSNIVEFKRVINETICNNSQL